MTARTLRIIRIIVAAALGITAAWSVATENFIALLTAVVLAMVLIFFFSRATKEGTNMLYAKASRMAIAVTMPLAAITSVVLIALKEHLPSEVVIAAYTLAYFCCVILLVHSFFYSYYNRKS